jgi:hypothetical protein
MLLRVRPIHGRPIPIGRQGEHLARLIDFSDTVERFMDAFGAGTCEVRYQRPTETSAYIPAVIDTTGGGLVWKPTQEDTAIAGQGRLELRYLVDGRIAKSRTWDVLVEASLVMDGDTPGEYDYYTGAYEVMPDWAGVSLDTSDKVCTDDIDILPIQKTEVDNEAGGRTLTI